MSNTPSNEPAFPTNDNHPGMTMREYYAAAALKGLMANPSWNSFQLFAVGIDDAKAPEAAAMIAFAYADAMLARSEKPPT